MEPSLHPCLAKEPSLWPCLIAEHSLASLVWMHSYVAKSLVPSNFRLQLEAPLEGEAWTATLHNSRAQIWVYLITKLSLCPQQTLEHSLWSHLFAEHSQRPCSTVKPHLKLCLNMESSQQYHPVGEHNLRPHLTRSDGEPSP